MSEERIDLRKEMGKQSFAIRDIEAIETFGEDHDWIVYLKSGAEYLLRCSQAMRFEDKDVIFS